MLQLLKSRCTHAMLLASVFKAILLQCEMVFLAPCACSAHASWILQPSSIIFPADIHHSLTAGVTNPEMTFGDELQDPPPKRRRKEGKAAAAEAAAAQADAAEPSGAELADSEPAELTRTGAAQVVADADATIPTSTGKDAGSIKP